jgi:hypothetical protein
MAVSDCDGVCLNGYTTLQLGYFVAEHCTEKSDPADLRNHDPVWHLLCEPWVERSMHGDECVDRAEAVHLVFPELE